MMMASLLGCVFLVPCFGGGNNNGVPFFVPCVPFFVVDGWVVVANKLELDFLGKDLLFFNGANETFGNCTKIL